MELNSCRSKACSVLFISAERFDVTLHGNGFTKTDNISQVRCNFILDGKDQSMYIYLCLYEFISKMLQSLCFNLSCFF